ncbi:MAG: hypothetical protein Q4D85_00055 [Corynebacterium sp.]|uniref:hypothetical protein n=1 Tax=Corynebacterium sp. TaxID=1720 RepID=UPI0026DB92B9|nr:hypothetical protein [Corynebacterium sp.]MDO5097118.1 hypothetical protein [Corynebacterium sp.]
MDVAASKSEQQVTEKRTYQGFSKGEAAFGLLWLSIGSLLSVLLEVVYLGTWIFGVPVPYTIPIAFFFNMVLTKTAMLWSKNTTIALIPLWVWVAGFFMLTMMVSVTGDQLVGANIRSILLLVAGVIGGGWPMIAQK